MMTKQKAMLWRDYKNDVTNDKITPLCNAENKSDYNEAINHHLEVVKESCNFNEGDYNNVTSSEKVLNCSENDACAVNMKTIQNYEIDTLSVNVDRCKLGSQDWKSCTVFLKILFSEWHGK